MSIDDCYSLISSSFEEWLESKKISDVAIISLLRDAYEKGFEKGYQKRQIKNYEEWNQK